MTIIEGYNFPQDLYYHKGHAWAKIEPDGNIRAGINDFYLKSAGEITYIDLPFEDDEVVQGEICARIQSSKWIGKFVSPISGVIIKANLDLELNSTILNKSPYDNGWIIIIKPSNLKKELKNLFKVDDLRPWLEKEIEKAEKNKK
jgi:glycine cleavage system H protein